MRGKAGFAGLIALLSVLGSTGVASAKLDDHAFSDPQPLPATFKLNAPDSGLQQYAIFRISGEASKKVFKNLDVEVTVNSPATEPVLRYAALFSKAKTKKGVTTMFIGLPINNVSEGEPLGIDPGAVCKDQSGSEIECPPGTIDVTISTGKSKKGIVLTGGLELAATAIVDDLTLEELQALKWAKYFGYDFPTPPKKIAKFVLEDAEFEGIDIFNPFAGLDGDSL
jgi:hypothetical protein